MKKISNVMKIQSEQRIENTKLGINPLIKPLKDFPLI